MAGPDASAAFIDALIAGGVEFVTAFPGSPTTALAQRIEREGPARGLAFNWAINENVALCQAFGAAMAGRGAAVLMKHVGVNVAADALQAMGVVHGLAAPLLLVEGADAKPGSSQSAQDNRSLYAASPQLLVLGPSTAAEIGELVSEACTISRGAGMLVVIRGDARCFQAEGAIPLGAARAEPPPSSFSPWPERGASLSTSARTYAHHLGQRERVWAALAPWLATRWVGWGLESDRRLHLAVVVAAHLGEPIAARARARGLPGLRLRSEHPLPVDAIVELARRCQELVVLEECTPTLEHEIAARVHAAGLPTPVRGRRSFGDTRPVGRLEGAVLDELLDAALRRCPPGMRCRRAQPSPAKAPALAELLAGLPAALLRGDRELDADSPASGFPASDPRRALFAALRELADGPVFVAADPGITGVLALADHGCDVKMHMGGAVPIAAGWSRARPEGLAVAVVGDTNLPHSEWLGLLDALDHGDDLLVIVADNGSSEMTQRIVTPRLSPERARASLEAAGLPCLRARATTKPGDPWHHTLREAAARSGPRLLWLEL